VGQFFYYSSNFVAKANDSEIYTELTPLGQPASTRTQSCLQRSARVALAASIFPKYDARMPYLVYRVWMRHLHYTHNLAGDPPPPVDKSSKKMCRRRLCSST
jgi:hypothetical protein